MSKGNNWKPKVGYKNPPVETRFQRGKSGNPAGRPKKVQLTFREVIWKELTKPIHKIVAGRRRPFSAADLLAKHTINEAGRGNWKALALLIKVVGEGGSQRNESLPPIVEALRGLHAKHETIQSNSDPTRDDSGSAIDLPHDGDVNNDDA